MDLSVVSHLGPAQRGAVQALLDAVARHDDHPALADGKLVEITGVGQPSGFAVVATDGARVVGYVHASRGEGGVAWNLQAVVHPEARSSSLALDVARLAVDEAWGRGANRVQWWAFRASPADDALAAGLDLRPWRDLYQMRRPLPHPDPVELPGGVRLRAFEPGRDEDAWLEVNRRAFSAHPEQRVFGLADLRARMAEPWFDREGFLLAEDAAGLAGFCWTKVPDERSSEIYVIATDPRWQGRGLGRALVLAGLHHMAARGVPTATLYVDAENTDAVSLYEALGFTVHHVDRSYAADR